VVAQGSQLLLQTSCKQLIAFSGATLNLAAIDWRRRMHPRQADELLGKTIVLHPPQPVLNTFEKKPGGSDRRFLFIGRDFYRKGGLELLEALHALKNRGLRDWQATVVGDLDSFGDYASRTSSIDRTRALWLLGELADVVTHRSAFSQAEVHHAMTHSDFYVLPTLADTYGYGVLEAQAHGTVCITTNVRALPELVGDETGFCISLPLDEFRNAHSHPQFGDDRRELVDGLVDILVACLKMSAQDLKRKADTATQQLRSRHSPDDHRDCLDLLYRRAIDFP
jgi:glycosyltransferase involved in cell wall biosynthesis